MGSTSYSVGLTSRPHGRSLKSQVVLNVQEYTGCAVGQPAYAWVTLGDCTACRSRARCRRQISAGRYTPD